jgi:hypothetical protein
MQPQWYIAPRYTLKPSIAYDPWGGMSYQFAICSRTNDGFSRFHTITEPAFNKLRPILQHISRTAKCAWKLLPSRSAGLVPLSLPAACSLCWCEAACLAEEKGKARSELFEYCRQVFHSSWNSLFVGPGIAKDQPPARQRLERAPHEQERLDQFRRRDQVTQAQRGKEHFAKGANIEHPPS